MTYPKTLAASATYDITSEGARVSAIKITNTGSGIVYYGDIPQAAVVRTGVTGTNGEYTITLASEADALAVQQGMTAADGTGNMDGNAVVVSKSGAVITVTGANTDDLADATVTFTPPDISTTNGHPINPGESHFLDADDWNLQHGLRIVADGSGTSLIITKKLA